MYMGIMDEISTIFVNKPVEKWARSSFIELIFLYFWLFAQIFSDKEMPAVSKRGFLMGIKRWDSPQPAKES